MKRLLCLLLSLLLPACALGESLPVIVSLGLASDTVRVSGRRIEAAGVGKRAPWGIHEADVIYETMLYQTGQTRLACVFQSSYPHAVGPVRSARASHFYLREEWQAALVFAGDAGIRARDAVQQEISFSSPLMLNSHRSALLKPYLSRQKGVKAPDNLSVDLAGLSSELLSFPAKEFPLKRGTTSAAAGISLHHLTLDWGNDAWQTRLVYSESEDLYHMYRKDAPFLSFPSAQERTEEQAVPLAFQAVIVQYVHVDWLSRAIPIPKNTGSGKADYLIGGRLIHGSWSRTDASSPTRYLDEAGEEMFLPDGKLYIAQFPAQLEQLTDAASCEMICIHHP